MFKAPLGTARVKYGSTPGRDARAGRTKLVGPTSDSGLHLRQYRFAARVRGHEVAWGSDTGGQHE